MMKMNSLQLLLYKNSLKGKMYFSWKTKKNDEKNTSLGPDIFHCPFCSFLLVFLFLIHSWFKALLFYLLEKEMLTHFSILGWRILWTEEPCGLLF